MEFRPKAPPPSQFIYYSGYLALAVGITLVVLGGVRLDWISLLYGACALIFGVLYMGFLGWWRERFEAVHPDRVDEDITSFERLTSEWSLRVVRRLTRFR